MGVLCGTEKRGGEEKIEDNTAFEDGAFGNPLELEKAYKTLKAKFDAAG